MKVVVMIPAFNEEGSIGSVIQRIPSIEGHDITVLVIDDGSSDRTSEIALGMGAKVVRNTKNFGLGRTLKIGLTEAIILDADVVVNIDADGQYNPEDIPQLIQPIFDRKADLVLANRFEKMKYKMPLVKRWGNKFTSWCVRKLSGVHVKDCQTGFRAISRALAETLQVFLKGTYTYTQEMIIHAKFNGFEIRELNMEFNERINGESRLISSVFSYFFKVTKIMVSTYKDYKPLQFFGFLSSIFILFGLSALLMDSYGQLEGRHMISFINITNDPKIILTIFFPLATAFFLFMFGFVLDIINRTRTSLVQENVLLRHELSRLSQKMDQIKETIEKRGN
jgi:glycosyltransferase involved in cell wall biosynthesis